MSSSEEEETPLQSYYHNTELENATSNESLNGLDPELEQKISKNTIKSSAQFKTPTKLQPLKSTDIIHPKAVIPYFLRLLLTNQVRSKESEEALARERDENVKALLEEESKKNIGEFDEKSQITFSETVFEDNIDANKYEPKVLRTAVAGSYYLNKNIGRRGGAGKTEGIDEPLHRRWSRTVWRKEIENLEPEYRLPALILKKHLYIKNQEPTRLGPGTYDVDYETNAKKKRLAATRGSMFSCTARFPKEVVANQNPGPGAYGYPYGVQDKAERDGIHRGNVSLFLSGPCDVRGQTFKVGGSSLRPGQYHFKGSINELLDKRVSKRGPYDLYTPDRLSIPYGYYKTIKQDSNLGPGKYNVRRSMKLEMNLSFNKYKGRFSPHNREKKVTGERISLVSPLWPIDTELYPGPGQYDFDSATIGRNKKQNKYAFQTSGPARPKDNPDYDMAPSKYNPELKYCPIGCGHKSIFKSKTGRLDQLQIPVLSERVRPKDIPQEERLAWNTQ